MGTAAHEAVGDLILELSNLRPKTINRAAHALGVLRQQPERVIPELAKLLDADDTEIVKAAADAICNFGLIAEVAVEPLLRAIQTAIANTRDDCRVSLIRALAVASPNPRQVIRQHFADDAELRTRAVGSLSAQQHAQAEQD